MLASEKPRPAKTSRAASRSARCVRAVRPHCQPPPAGRPLSCLSIAHRSVPPEALAAEPALTRQPPQPARPCGRQRVRARNGPFRRPASAFVSAAGLARGIAELTKTDRSLQLRFLLTSRLWRAPAFTIPGLQL